MLVAVFGLIATVVTVQAKNGDDDIVLSAPNLEQHHQKLMRNLEGKSLATDANDIPNDIDNDILVITEVREQQQQHDNQLTAIANQVASLDATLLSFDSRIEALLYQMEQQGVAIARLDTRTPEIEIAPDQREQIGQSRLASLAGQAGEVDDEHCSFRVSDRIYELTLESMWVLNNQPQVLIKVRDGAHSTPRMYVLMLESWIANMWRIEIINTIRSEVSIRNKLTKELTVLQLRVLGTC